MLLAFAHREEQKMTNVSKCDPTECHVHTIYSKISIIFCHTGGIRDFTARRHHKLVFLPCWKLEFETLHWEMQRMNGAFGYGSYLTSQFFIRRWRFGRSSASWKLEARRAAMLGGSTKKLCVFRWQNIGTFWSQPQMGMFENGLWNSQVLIKFGSFPSKMSFSSCRRDRIRSSAALPWNSGASVGGCQQDPAGVQFQSWMDRTSCKS